MHSEEKKIRDVQDVLIVNWLSSTSPLIGRNFRIRVDAQILLRRVNLYMVQKNTETSGTSARMSVRGSFVFVVMENAVGIDSVAVDAFFDTCSVKYFWQLGKIISFEYSYRRLLAT